MPAVTPALLESLAPADFSVLPDQNVLVLVYPQDGLGRDMQMFNILHENPINVRVIEENETRRHVIEIEFPNTRDIMRLVFNKTEDDYPLRRYTNNGVIHSISAGIANGQQVMYIQPPRMMDIQGGGPQNN